MMRQMVKVDRVELMWGQMRTWTLDFSLPAGTARCAQAERVQGSTTIDIDQSPNSFQTHACVSFHDNTSSFTTHREYQIFCFCLRILPFKVYIEK